MALFKEAEANSSAGARRRAMYLAESYAPYSFDSLKEVGAALDYAIARLAREYKQNNVDVRRKVAKRYGDGGSADITMSMRVSRENGESLQEAAYTACKAVMAAVNGNVASRHGNAIRLTLDGYSGVLAANWRDSKKAWIITGYKENGEKSSADDRRRALSLAESYALDSFGGLKEVGAALDYAIARLAREYKQNNADVRRKLRAGDDITMSMRASRERVWEVLSARPEEVVLEKVRKEFGRVIEQLAAYAGGKMGALMEGVAWSPML